jgi:valyl-tRNA synthetase
MPELAKAYEPAQVEDRIYSGWLEKNYFRADPAKVTDKRPAYSIVIPPPNITGVLTMGHVLNNTIQDILVRKARMEGKEVLWLPGTDHAGLATQTAVERALRKEGKTRHDVGRDEFLRLVWEWQKKHGGIIIQQLKKLGCSCDWSRERFTMDNGYVKAVLGAFVKLYNKGLIYRGLRMVNWCPGSLTAISDEEVIPKPQKGHLWYIKYPVVGQPGRFLEVATVRPETIMGDVAVAVNPNDERYRDLIGKTVMRPFPAEPIPVIADALVDAAFGTGALKITPAHSKDDWEISQRHKLVPENLAQLKEALKKIDVLTEKGRINCPAVRELHGMERFEARKKAVELLREKELLTREEPYENNVGFSERADVPIEPRLSEQWFLKYPRVEESRIVVKDKRIRFYPEHWAKVYDHWLENIQDWCISRQVWWGHRIPVWYRNGEQKCQIESPGAGWEQDSDTLDTWCSSWLWAYATMDKQFYPSEDANTLQKFYPTDVLVTGPDIIFLWVARMIIAGLEFDPKSAGKTEDKIPFKEVYFTGLIRDRQGRKMSKSLGNSPDPLELIAKYGADGLRFGLMRIAPQGQDIKFDEKQIEEGRNFCNKLWNACRFRMMQGSITSASQRQRFLNDSSALSVFAQELWRQLVKTIQYVNDELTRYEFSAAAEKLYDFIWNDFCSRYLEVAKVEFASGDSARVDQAKVVIDTVLDYCLRLLHPYAPFVTEELWTQLGFGNTTIQLEQWPALPAVLNAENLKERESTEKAEAIYSLVEFGRRLRSESGLATNQKAPFMLIAKQEVLTAQEQQVTTALLNADKLELVTQKPGFGRGMPSSLGDLYLMVQVDATLEKARLEKELSKLTKDIEITDKKLGNAEMLAKAPAEKVAQWHKLAAELKEKEAKLKSQLEAL